MPHDGVGREDEMAWRREIFRAAERRLFDSVDRLRRRYRPDDLSDDLVQAIKQTVHRSVPPYGLSVLQTLGERERDRVFNSQSGAQFPDIKKGFVDEILRAVDVGVGPRRHQRAVRFAENTWKQDAAADRRARAQKDKPHKRWRSPYRGQPEVYDAPSVGVFCDAIAAAVGRTRFERGNRQGGLMMDALVAAMEWAMIVAWLGTAPMGTPVPKATRQGLVNVIRKQKPMRTIKSPRPGGNALWYLFLRATWRGSEEAQRADSDETRKRKSRPGMHRERS